MKIARILIITIYIFSFSACSPGVVEHIGYQPPMVPITITIDSNGDIQVQWEGRYQTPIGTFSVGVDVNPAQLFPNANGTLTVRINGADIIYDLAGNENIDIELDSGYYKEISLRKAGKNWVFEAVKISEEDSSGYNSSDNTNSDNIIQSSRDACDGSLSSRLKAGGFAYVAEDPPISNRVREGAGFNYEQTGSILSGHSMKVLDGPVCADGAYWWKVQALRNSSVIGWTMEGDRSAYWLVPCNSESSCP